jgi:hypothetical protein
MTDKGELDCQVRQAAFLAAFLTVGLASALVFGLIVLISGDWLPGTIIIVAALMGLAKQVPVVRRL